MKRTEAKKFFNNFIRFTAPGIAIFFSQLALGADYKVAGTTALLVIYGLLSDYFKKIKK